MAKKVDRIALERELGKRSLLEFVKMAWTIVKPGDTFSSNFHVEQLCRHLEACYNKEVQNLCVNQPPATGKSVVANVFFPAWVWTKKPNAHFVYTGYNESMLEETSVLCADLVASQWYQDRWGDICSPKEGNWAKHTIKNSAGGIRWSVSFKGSITGKHVDFLFIDDPIRPKDVNKKELDTINKIYSNTIPSRVAKKKGSIVLIMQRLHENDLAANLLKLDTFTHLCFPMEYKEGHFTYNKLGRYDPREKEGDLLWEEFFPAHKLAEQKIALGPFEYSAQYQQLPVPAEGGLFKKETFRFWKADQLPPRMELIQSWDTTLSKSIHSDYVVGQVWGKADGKYYLLDQIRGKMGFEETKQAIRVMTAKWPRAVSKYIEEKASGPAVIENLQKELSGIIPVKVSNSTGGKEQRAVSITGLFEAGLVFFPDPTEHLWVNELIEEIATFPKGRHDDQVDAMTQALQKLYKRSMDDLITGLRQKLSWR